MPTPTQSTADQVIRPVTDREFALFQKLIYNKAGIHLAPAKKALLEARLMRRLRDLGLSSFEAYYRHILAVDDSEELVVLLNRIATNETHFFREPRQFEFLENQVFPGWKSQRQLVGASRHIRIWSAACSTGEEPYSIAMMLWNHFPPGSGWDFEILATDLSTRVLDAAAAAVWPITKAGEIPHEYLKKYMLKGTGEQNGKMKAGAELRSVIRFERLNLNEQRYPVDGQFRPDLLPQCHDLFRLPVSRWYDRAAASTTSRQMVICSSVMPKVCIASPTAFAMSYRRFTLTAVNGTRP